MRTLAAHALLVALCSACAGGAEEPSAGSQVDASMTDDLPDADGDGLCDFTEEELGTDPSAADTDEDGLPDLVELYHGFFPTDWSSPAPTQLAQLEARRSARSEFAARFTVDGDGQGITGDFSALPSPYADGYGAADFFAGASAVSASPEDAVRAIDPSSARFAGVFGHTRLTFNLRFAYPWEELGAFDCARTYPFRYSVKADNGETRAINLYVLVVSPEGTLGAAARHCLPRHCQ